MKKSSIALLLVLGLLVSAFPAFGLTANDGETLNGAHYNLNIIGVQNPKTATMDGANGNVIFVNLEGYSKIGLQEGEDYAVLDKNGTDANGAMLQLPDPGLDPYIIGEVGDADTVSDYSVYVRPLGKPGGWSTITTCAELLDSTFGGLIPSTYVKTIKNRAGYFGGYASIEQVGQDITMRTKGKTSFTNVTAQLLTIVFKVDLDYEGDGIIDDTIYVRVPIFDDALQGEYWEYDNNNLKLLQVRFYPWGTDVSEADLLAWQ